MPFSAAIRLMRLDKPVGIALLWWPTAWALWLFYAGAPPYWLVGYFFLGTCLMRSAGCVVNDIADRNIDKHVVRTRLRPLTNGDISLIEAFSWLITLLGLSLLILLQLPSRCYPDAIISVLVAMSYPFFKRFFKAPQIVLSIAFSMGMVMIYHASFSSNKALLTMLFVLNILWVLAYDTIYACIDESDDKKIGIYSTARFFGRYKVVMIVLCQMAVHLGWLLLLFKLASHDLAYVAWGGAGLNLVRQWRDMQKYDASLWLSAFKKNAGYGFWLWLSLVLAFQ